MKTALAITHVAFENLGSLKVALQNAGYGLEERLVSELDFAALDPLAYDLVIVLGGPIGVYEQAAYPFLATEIAWLRTRLAKQAPTLGICLGAQLIAAALGARVYPGTQGKEIGWKPLQPGADIEQYPAMRHLLEPALPVLHWHGDTFDLPVGAHHLAASDLYPNQAYAVGKHVMGLQFHPEVTAVGLEQWYIGHACELSAAHIDVIKLRQDSATYAPNLVLAAQRFWAEWLTRLEM